MKSYGAEIVRAYEQKAVGGREASRRASELHRFRVLGVWGLLSPEP